MPASIKYLVASKGLELLQSSTCSLVQAVQACKPADLMALHEAARLEQAHLDASAQIDAPVDKLPSVRQGKRQLSAFKEFYRTRCQDM